MKTIILRINNDLPNYLCYFIKVSISILLLMIYGSAYTQKKYDFQVNIYGKETPMNLITGYCCSGAYLQKPIFVLGSKYEALKKSQHMLSEQYKYVKKLTLHTTNSKHFIMYDQPMWFFELDTFLK
ncbi:hypothetical protein [Sphingobacterium multivorum]|uniref:hypothetical protein n=1 Tax=Sphingobacterium multivorum TaxID=28454 RepID=UPI0031BA183A